MDETMDGGEVIVERVGAERGVVLLVWCGCLPGKFFLAFVSALACCSFFCFFFDGCVGRSEK
jgi:hypothetical protein